MNLREILAMLLRNSNLAEGPIEALQSRQLLDLTLRLLLVGRQGEGLSELPDPVSAYELLHYSACFFSLSESWDGPALAGILLDRAAVWAVLRLRPELGRIGEQRSALLGRHFLYTNSGLSFISGVGRKQAGAWYTPAPLAEWLIKEVTTPETQKLCDPTCGAGHLLLAAVAAGIPAVYGLDLDPVAVELCRVRLKEAGVPSEVLRQRIRKGNALIGLKPLLEEQAAEVDARLQQLAGAEVGGLCPFHWHLAWPEVAEGFDALIGNPPFLNQLENRTLTDKQTAALLRKLYPGLVNAYTDIAALILYRAAGMLRMGGRLALIQPQATLATQHAAGVRGALSKQGRLIGLWYAGAPVFDASVLACGVAFMRGEEKEGNLSLSQGVIPQYQTTVPVDMTVVGSAWAPLLAPVLGVPQFALSTQGCVRDIAEATADFRDEYYGLAPYVVDREIAEEAEWPRLITSGLIAPAACAWGQEDVRFLKQRWRYPRVDGAALKAGPLGSWAIRRLVPKLLLATQTRTLEVWVDPVGSLLGTTPVITLMPHDPQPEQLWRIAAVLLSPVASAWARLHYGLSALSAQAIKLSASQVLEVPLPVDESAWIRAAHWVQQAHENKDQRREALIQAAKEMILAYQTDAGLLAWWLERLDP